MQRYARLDDRSILLLVNLAAEAVDVRMINRQGEVVNGYDILNQEEVKGGGIHLEVKSVRLIELEE
jgi:hypothetical protein